MKIKKVNMVEVDEWDKLVEKTYGRTYSFQQQEDCRDRGVFNLTVPSKDTYDFKNNTVPEIVNHDKQGVSFRAWLKRDPNKPLGDEEPDKGNNKTYINMWWERNFYPDIQMVANDLHSKGLLEAGEYIINIDW